MNVKNEKKDNVKIIKRNNVNENEKNVNKNKKKLLLI